MGKDGPLNNCGQDYWVAIWGREEIKLNIYIIHQKKLQRYLRI